MKLIKSMHHLNCELTPLQGKSTDLHVSESGGLQCTLKILVTPAKRIYHFFGLIGMSDEMSKNCEEKIGYIILKRVDGSMPEKSVKLKLERGCKTFISFELPNGDYWKTVKIGFECHVMFVRRPTENLENPQIMAPDVDDTALEVDGKIIQVNTEFLTAHSEYFRCLFSENFSDAKNPKIGEVSFEDFSLLLSTFYPPINEEINDDDVIILLDLARRFLLTCATEKVEEHLIHKSTLEKEVIFELAREYQLESVLEYEKEEKFRQHVEEGISHPGLYHFPE